MDFDFVSQDIFDVWCIHQIMKVNTNYEPLVILPDVIFIMVWEVSGFVTSCGT